MHSKTIEELKKVVALNDLPDEHLQWLSEHMETNEYEDGMLISKSGDPADHMWFIPQGSVDFYMDVNGQQIYYYKFRNDQESGGVSGLLPYSRMKVLPGYTYAVGKTKTYKLHKKYFHELEQLNPELIQRLIGYMTERARSFATTQLQHEKVSALGRLSAGIAHEMNNPASAINRISSELSKRLKENYFLTEKLLQYKISAEHIQSIKEMIQKKELENMEKLKPIQRMQKEDDIHDWLRKNGLEGNSIDVEIFAETGINGDDLDMIRSNAEKDEFIQILKWAENLLMSQRIIKDLEEASTRISNLVGAIKSHVHMDQTNEFQLTDIHHGIEDTLTLMGYKLREKNIKVNKKFSGEIPEIPAYIGELNQVWTNLIDNAIYALSKPHTIIEIFM
jgi:signal transduction histidine kinase